MLHKLTLFLLISTSVFSQQEISRFSLKEAVDFALENNSISKNATRDVEIAKLQKWETTSTGLPQIKAAISYNNWLKQQISLIPAEFFGGAPGQFAEIAFGTKQTMNGTVTITQKIFDGSYLVGLQAAKVYLEISENAKEKTEIELRKMVAYAYGNVLLSEENLKIVNSNITLLENNVRDLTKVYENGLIEEESVQQLQLTLSSLKSNQSYVKRLKTIAYQLFNNALGLELNTPIELTDDLDRLIAIYTSLAPLESILEAENVVDYKIAFNDLQGKELLLKLEKSKALPTIEAFLNGSYSGNSEQFNFLDDSQNWFGASLFGVTMKVPIFSSFGRSASTKKARLNLEKSKSLLKDTSDKIKLEISRARSDYEFAVENLVIKKEALKLSENIAQKNEIKFFEGLTTSFDLSQAQRQLYTAQQDYLQSMLNILIKRIDLEALINPPLKN
ncbi:transporter [Formosa sp. Hel1_33_131]|jgi:outer membrane protein TolC|uniref:TolC family protein n=1 Tax=Formosa sp. Hel1_33_131 TaxID=1336794 RepID=UPI00084E2C8A|nr:TolC family protein [Formosa sp. Hel1_33_131]AOR28511.1 transporter [Formosa sp. Hel1_33_131]